MDIEKKIRNAWRRFLIGMAPQVLTYIMVLLPHYEYGGGYGAAFIVFILFPIGLILVGISFLQFFRISIAEKSLKKTGWIMLFILLWITFVILNISGIILLPSNTIPIK